MSRAWFETRLAGAPHHDEGGDLQDVRHGEEAAQQPSRTTQPRHDRSPCGSLRVTVHTTTAALRPSGALWLAGERALVAGDLHLEKGSAYAARGQLLPPYDTRDTLNRLAAEVAATQPRLIVLLGDTLHDGGARERIERDDIRLLAELARGRTLLWVVGNHDPDGPGEMPGEAVDTLPLEGLTLRHEPLPGVQPGEVAGHLHPCARVVGGGRSVRRRCFVSDGRRLILPAFGAYAGGLNVRNKAFESLFERPPMIGALGAARVHAVGWRSTRGD